jgi:Protein of unknown function (DUF3175)
VSLARWPWRFSTPPPSTAAAGLCIRPRAPSWQAYCTITVKGCHDPQAQHRGVPPLLAATRSENWTATESRHVQDTRSGGEARTRRAVLQATWMRHAVAKTRPKRRWVRSVKTDSTAPPPGTFTRSAQQIARTMARRDVSPKGLVSGIRMIQYFINRAGRNLTARRRRELERAKRILGQWAQASRKRRSGGVSPAR